MAEAKGVESVDRALKILDCFSAETQEISLADLSRATDFYKSTILRLTTSLERFGYLVRGDSGLFRLGPTAWRIGSCYRQSFNLADILRPELKVLCEATNETASFYIREGNSRICLYRFEPSRAIRHSISEGASMPLDRGASGKLISAYSGEQSNNSKDIRHDGYVISLGERDPEVAAVSVPLIRKSGDLVGALAISGLISRFDDEACEFHVSALLESQKRLTDQLSE